MTSARETHSSNSFATRGIQGDRSAPCTVGVPCDTEPVTRGLV